MSRLITHKSFKACVHRTNICNIPYDSELNMFGGATDPDVLTTTTMPPTFVATLKFFGYYIMDNGRASMVLAHVTDTEVPKPPLYRTTLAEGTRLLVENGGLSFHGKWFWRKQGAATLLFMAREMSSNEKAP